MRANRSNTNAHHFCQTPLNFSPVYLVLIHHHLMSLCSFLDNCHSCANILMEVPQQLFQNICCRCVRLAFSSYLNVFFYPKNFINSTNDAWNYLEGIPFICAFISNFIPLPRYVATLTFQCLQYLQFQMLANFSEVSPYFWIYILDVMHDYIFESVASLRSHGVCFNFGGNNFLWWIVGFLAS